MKVGGFLCNINHLMIKSLLVMNMYSILNETISEIEVEHSRFIGIAMHINHEKEIKNLLDDVKKRYPKARHYCYAVVIDNYLKSSDDGEPQGTAGRPMLEVLTKNNLNRVLVVVVRYFGGTLLGAARLLRTYVETTNSVISKAMKFELVYGYSITLSTSYSEYNNIINYLKRKNVDIVNSEFKEDIVIKTFASFDYEEEIKAHFFQKMQIIAKNKENKYKKVGD